MNTSKKDKLNKFLLNGHSIPLLLESWIEIIGNQYIRIGIYKCTCGNLFKTRTNNVNTLNTLTCGCKTILNENKNGLYYHRLKHIHRGMMRRCYKSYDKHFNDYGGRGILVCSDWHKLENFVRDMFPSYKEGLTIERIDNNKGYSIDNCRWATMQEQQVNRRSNRLFTYNGETLTISQWARKLNISQSSLCYRINTAKYDFKDVVERPKRIYKQKNK